MRSKKKWREKLVPGKNVPFIVRNCCLEEINSGSQRKIVNWGGRSKFITTLSKSVWKRWKTTANPKNPHLKLQNDNNPSSKLG
jgi:hypothetical protein